MNCLNVQMNCTNVQIFVRSYLLKSHDLITRKYVMVFSVNLSFLFVFQRIESWLLRRKVDSWEEKSDRHGRRLLQFILWGFFEFYHLCRSENKGLSPLPDFVDECFPKLTLQSGPGQWGGGLLLLNNWHLSFSHSSFPGGIKRTVWLLPGQRPVCSFLT